MTDNGKIYFHADDYGVTLEQSARILECYTQGALNSISVIPNAPQLAECLQLLQTAEHSSQKGKIRRVLHLNFVEGKPAAPIEKVVMLVDETGYFNCSFIKLLAWSYTKRGNDRKQLKKQLKTEIAAQMEQVFCKVDYQITAIDSHQHYHMIPIVQEALLEVLVEKEYTIEEIRIPVDPLLPLLKTPELWFKVPLINWMKWGILWIHAGKSRRQFRDRKISSPIFFGIFFTCEMRQDVVACLLPKYQAYAQKKGENLELMFHPGNLTSSKELLDERSEELKEFYLSENRKEEAVCLKAIGRV